jgi:hypothetical protein
MNVLLSLFYANAYRLNTYTIPKKIVSESHTLNQSLTYYEQKLHQLLSAIESAKPEDHRSLLTQLAVIEEQILELQRRVFSLSSSQKESLIAQYTTIRMLYLRALIAHSYTDQVVLLQKRVEALKDHIQSLAS